MHQSLEQIPLIPKWSCECFMNFLMFLVEDRSRLDGFDCVLVDGDHDMLELV